MPGALDGYQRRLLVFLSVATFFEGYDFIALAQLLPELRADLGLDTGEGGGLVSFINLGTVAAYVLVRLADRWGRRRLLTVTIAGYTLFTFLSGLAPGARSFAVFQFVARMFLIAEWATSMVVAAEEFPAARRGFVIGIIQGCSSLGSIACAGLVPLLVQTRWGWRTVYFVGIIPLVLLAYARRGLRETRRFAEQEPPAAAGDLLRIWRTPYRGRLVALGAVWTFTYLCTHNAVTFWKEFAIAERALSPAQVAASIAIAAVASMPFVFYAGKLIDQVGRRRGAVVIFGLTVAGVFGCYTLHGQAALTVALVFGIFGASAVLHVLNAFTAELFPTDLRGDAFAWSNNLLGRLLGYVPSPWLVGVLAADVGWGSAMRLTVLGPIVALALIWLLLPETGSRELEETAALGDAPRR
jgi:putative MFS transporter